MGESPGMDDIISTHVHALMHDNNWRDVLCEYPTTALG